MESRYYLFHGQTLKNTSISDRSHALHITKSSWERIRRHLDRNKLAKEEKEKEEAHKSYLGEGSRAMIKNWANSLENVRKRKEEEREKAIEDEKKRRQEKFVALKKEQEQMQKLFVDKAQKAIFMTSGTAKMLTAAYIEGEVMLEREKQIEFKNKIRQHEKDEEAKEIENIKRVAKEHADEVKGERARDKQKKKEWGDYMRQFLSEKARKENEEAKKQKLEEERDYQAAWDEIKCMEQMDEENRLKKKRELKANVCDILKKERDARLLEKTEEKEQDECIQAFREAREIIECKKKAREIQIRQETIERRLAATKHVFEGRSDALVKEEESMQRAMAEKDAEALERLKQKQEKREKEIRDKIEDRQQFLKREEERSKKEEEMKKWEKLNRFKTAEVIKKSEEVKRLKERQKISEYRKDILQQIAEDKATEQRERERDEYITKAIALNDDERFFELADEMMAHAKAKGRATRPIDLAILEYKKINLLDYERPVKDDPARCVDYMEGMKGYTKKFIKKANQDKKDK